jgi:hypothetical protein
MLVILRTVASLVSVSMLRTINKADILNGLNSTQDSVGELSWTLLLPWHHQD